MKKKVLFIDRDGTMVLEPADEQVDALEKVRFYPNVFEYLARIVRELDFELVMVTNQDGLGTDSFPEHTFWPTQKFILDAFESQGISFDDICIDRTFAKDGAPTRKPGTALLTRYLKDDYDLSRSFVIGDRLSDVALAANLGSKAFYLNKGEDLDGQGLSMRSELHDSIALQTQSWASIYRYLKRQDRTTTLTRKTKETDIQIDLNLDGSGQGTIETGIGFFDHMLEQIARHGAMDLEILAKGDLHIDEHHTIEDTGIALGSAFKEALGKKVGIDRYGFTLPMDEALAQVAIDFSGRSFLVWDVEFQQAQIGDIPEDLFEHFFKSFCDACGCNLNVRVEGKNDHHKIESIFKAFAKALRMAVRRDAESETLPSTKGVL